MYKHPKKKTGDVHIKRSWLGGCVSGVGNVNFRVGLLIDVEFILSLSDVLIYVDRLLSVFRNNWLDIDCLVLIRILMDLKNRYTNIRFIINFAIFRYQNYILRILQNFCTHKSNDKIWRWHLGNFFPVWTECLPINFCMIGSVQKNIHSSNQCGFW